ncbi:MarR family winged helix-turn-helix transcriptional regulator [Actinokineospora pegani]|uniref:MarR family winged helix-turn-helix transcriptional regulator n=1 Tax=Actinokineospora pegani TaxID=2654637 RepID=UPI0012E9B6D7|nr:MarR family transcriptional regulator [Actinokineospora pegani]
MTTRNSTTLLIGDLLREYGVLGLRIGEAFAGRHAMEHVDLRALTIISQAERDGEPETVRGLRERLGLSSGGTTLVVDRLERAGHVQRARDPHDRRVVRLTITPDGAATGRRYFGGLATGLAAVAAGFADDELDTVRRFLAGVVTMTGEHLADIAAADQRE